MKKNEPAANRLKKSGPLAVGGLIFSEEIEHEKEHF